MNGPKTKVAKNGDTDGRLETKGAMAVLLLLDGPHPYASFSRQYRGWPGLDTFVSSHDGS